MIKSYVKVAARYLKSHKIYSVVNITGLTLGFFCFLILNAYVSHEKNFDTWHGNVYRVLQIETGEQGKSREIAPIGPRVGDASREQFPEIIARTKAIVLGRLTVGNEPGQKNYERITAVDDGFFKVFEFQFLEGNAENAFLQANAIILSKSLKDKYCGDEDCLGQTLKTNIFEGVVAGVIEDFPPNTHFEADLILPPKTASSIFNWWDNFVTSNWNNNAFVTYLKLREGTDISSLENKITRLAEDNWPEDDPFQSRFVLQDVRDIHLYEGEVEGEINQSRGNLFYVNIFFWIALIILLVACFNYTGLLNVAFKQRSREIGVRKVMGAGRRQLLWQFFIESLFLTSVSMLIAWGILHYSEPFLPNIFGTVFGTSTIPMSKLLMIGGIGLGISLLAIGYPVYIITRTDIVHALKDVQDKTTKIPFRRAVALFQFIAAISLIACTLVLYKQVNYLQQKELGFDVQGLVTVDINSGILRSKFEAIKQEFAKLPEVQHVSVSSRVPGEWKQFPFVDANREGQDISETNQMIFIGADQDFISTYELELLEGRNFMGNLSDSTKVLINASAVKALGLEDPVGKRIVIPRVNWSGHYNELDQPFTAQINGVVKDFHFEDFRKSISPMIIGFWNNPIHNIDYYTLRVTTNDWSNTIASLRRINDQFDQENPLEYHILNDQFERFYEGDLARSRLLFFFSSVVIFIACMGLFSMTAFILKNRTKEIGIRKVLGASITQIVSLVATDFFKLILLGAAIAIPIAWFLMKEWLDEFAYRIPLHWWLFAVAGIIAFLIAFFTIGAQSVRAAVANPVDSLRDE